MIVEVFGERVTVTNMEAKSNNKLIEEVVNLALYGGDAPQNGPFFILSEFFGDNVKLIEADEPNNNNVY